MHKSKMSIYSSKLKGLLNKQLDKDKLNGIYRVCLQLSYSWLNDFVRKKISRVKSIYSLKLKGSLSKRLDKNEMDGTERLQMRLSNS